MVTLSGPEGTLLTVDLWTSVVLGAATLTTTGAVPFVTSSGTLGQDGTNFLWDDASNSLTIGGDVLSSATSALYFGASGTDGTWRIVRSGNDLVIRRRESGNYVTKSTITA